MGYEPVDWYCRSVEDGFWARTSQNALGAYTPCGVQTFVLGISYVALVGLCWYRIWKTLKDTKVQRYCLKSKRFNYFLGVLAAYCAVEPLSRLFTGMSIANLDGETGFAPFEIVSLTIQSVAWCFVLIMVGIETKIYIRDFRWYVRFGIIYVLIGEAVMFNLIFSVRKFYDL